jgi:hypothetical protein
MKIGIFISYCSENINKVNSLKRYISKNEMLKAIFVADRRSPKTSLAAKVKEGLKSADYFVPILTKESINNQWVNQEIGFVEARGSKVKIFPVAEHSILKKLKGFIHKNLELPYCYESFQEKKKESRSFRKCVNLLLNDIIAIEKIEDDSNLKNIMSKLQRADRTDYRALDVPLNEKITVETKYHLRVNLSSNRQLFTAYYLIETNKNEERWIGYTNGSGPDFLRPNEYTKAIRNTNKTTYSIDENVLDTINSRFSNLEGKPIRIKIARFRGDRSIDEVVRFYFAFSKV